MGAYVFANTRSCLIDLCFVVSEITLRLGLCSNSWALSDTANVRVYQWQIQDFPERGANPKGEGHQPITWPIFPDNCIKMRKMGARGGASTTAY